MASVQELEKAVASLHEPEYSEFRQWFLDNDWERWDRQIAEDSKTGRLDFLAEEAAEAKSADNLRAL